MEALAFGCVSALKFNVGLMLRFCAFVVIVVFVSRGRWASTEDRLRFAVDCVRSSGVRSASGEALMLRSDLAAAVIAEFGCSRSAAYRLLLAAVDDGVLVWVSAVGRGWLAVAQGCLDV